MGKMFTSLLLFISFFCHSHCNGQSYWQTIEGGEPPVNNVLKRPVKHYKLYALHQSALRQLLAAADTVCSKSHIVFLPLADGELKPFYVWNTPVLEPLLAKKYPEIYRCAGR